jgi:hypothetical protein
MTSISGLVLAAYGFIASAFSWAWYESVEAALPSRSVIGFVAFAQIAATLVQVRTGSLPLTFLYHLHLFLLDSVGLRWIPSQQSDDSAQRS